MMADRVAKRIINPTVLPAGERDLPLLARTINNTIAGHLNVVGEVMLASGTTETRIDDPRIGAQSLFMWQALSATGAALVPTLWYKTRGVRYAIFGHAAPGADTWIEYAVLG